MSHFKLKATVDGSEVVSEMLELTGSKSFKVFPIEKNETGYPIRGSVVVNILGKNHSISLNHKVKTEEDPEPSSYKWSYIEEVYTTGSTPVPDEDIKDQDVSYVRASRGSTKYRIVPGGRYEKLSTISISKAYNTYTGLIDSVGDFSDTSILNTYAKGDVIPLFVFTMYYKYFTESEGQIIPPVDDGTPSSNKSRIPCRPDSSPSPYWITGGGIYYRVNFQKYNSGTSGVYYSDSREFSNWDDFIVFWESISINPEYRDATFHYIYSGVVDFNESLVPREINDNHITISEIDNGKGIHGAKNLYLNVSQQEGKNTYAASTFPIQSSWLDINTGEWSVPDESDVVLNEYRLSPDISDLGTYNFRPKFRLNLSDSTKWAKSITNSSNSVITNPEGAGTIDYQYFGQPFALKLFKETANGIEGIKFKPYYKVTSSGTTTELWKDFKNILGSQNFNPLKYERKEGNTHYLSIRNTGFRGFLSQQYGLTIFQLIPMCLYLSNGVKISNIDRLVGYTWVDRYLNYESSISSADNGIFLHWPNVDGNNDPDHIDLEYVETLPSMMGKDWENTFQDDSGFKIIDRVMFLPVLWCNTRLEENQNFREYLNSPRFGYYFLSPNISDTEIDNTGDAIYRICIIGLDIETE